MRSKKHFGPCNSITIPKIIICVIRNSCRNGIRSFLESGIGLLQLAITWYKIRHAGGEAHHYSRTGTLKQRDLNQ